MCPPRSSSTVGLKPPDSLDGRQTLASFSKWTKWASGEHKGRRSFSSRQCGWLRQAKFVEDELRKMAGRCNAQTREAANLQGHLNHRRSLALKSFPQCLPKFI